MPNDTQGPFTVGSERAGYVSGYMTLVPQSWRAMLGGPALTGQSTIPIITRTSFGPAVSVFDPDDIGVKDPVPATALLYYPQAHPLMNAWDVQSEYFNGTTGIRGVVFPEGTRSVLFFGRQGTGPFCYGLGTADRALVGTTYRDGVTKWCSEPDAPPEGSSKGNHAYPYRYQVWAYDALDLAKVKAGELQPWEVRPYAMWPLTLPQAPSSNSFASTYINGAAYDPARRRIFLTQDRGENPLVHVFTLSLP